MNQHDIYDILSKFRALETSEAAQTAADQVEKLNGVKAKLNESEMEESGLQAYLGKKKYGSAGMKALQQAGREGASKEKMAKIRAKHDKMDESKPDFLDLDKDGNKKEPMKSAARDAKKSMKEAAKPDYIDLDKDGNKKESMKKAAQDAKKHKKEQVNELSPDTLSSYADKARGQRNWAAGRAMSAQQGNKSADPQGKFNRLWDKRAAGYNQAVAKGATDIDKTRGLQSKGGPASSWNWSKDATPAALQRDKGMAEGEFKDSPAKSKVPAHQRKSKGGDWKVSVQDLEHEKSQSPTGRAGLEKAKRRLGQMSEGLDNIMRTMGRDIEQFKRSGELSDALYSALYDHYRDEMPYGIAKARTGDPYEWIMNKLEDELGVDEGNLFTGNLAKARAAGLKKADLDGDGDMEKVNELDINLIKAAQKDAAKAHKHSDPESDRNIHKKYGHRSDRDDSGNDDDYDEWGNEKKKRAQPAAGEKRGRGRPKKYTDDKPRQERVTAKSRKADRTAYTKKKVGEEELDEKAVSKAQQRFMGMAHAMQKGERIPGASKELKKVAKTMKKGDTKDFAKTKHAGLPEKKKKTDEMTTSGGVAPVMAPMGVRRKTKEEMTDVLSAEKGGVKGATQPPADSKFAPGDKRNSAPAPTSTPKPVKETDKVPTDNKEKKSAGGMQFGKGIYDSMNRALEGMIAESMQISTSMNTDAQGGPGKTLSITATDQDAEQLLMLLKMAGLGGGDDDTCPHCGQNPCACDHVDEDLANSPDTMTADTEVMTKGLAGGLNKQKSTGQTTVPVINVDPKRQGMLETMQQRLWNKYQG